MRLRPVLAVLLAMATVGPASADHAPDHESHVTFSALPCGVLCFLPADPLDPSQSGRDACGDGGVPGTFRTATLRAPAGATRLDVSGYPSVDWDTFLCGSDGVALAIGANVLGGPCEGSLHQRAPAGCSEHMSIDVEPGQAITLLAINVSDPFALFVRYRFAAD